MKLKDFVEKLEQAPSYGYPTSVDVVDLGVSRRGNRKLEIARTTYERPAGDWEPDEYVSIWRVVIDDEENILHSEFAW